MKRQAETNALGIIRRVGTACWALIGIVAVLALALAALGGISEIVLPLVFAAVIGIVFAPMTDSLERRGFKRWLAALLVVALLVAVVLGTIVFTVSAVVGELDTLSVNVDRAADAVVESDADAETLDQAREAVTSTAPLILGGFVTLLLGGVGTLVGLVAGGVLGILLLYYLLKDDTQWRSSLVRAWPSDVRPEVEAFLARSRATISAYAAGRAVLSAAIAGVITAWSAVIGLPMLGAIAVVNFIGGFVPYIGAIIGGALAVILALSTHGIGMAAATVAVLLVANFAIENLLEPTVLGGRLRLHPMLVLVITTLGGVVGGIVGLMLAVPLYIVASDAGRTAWRHMRGLAGDTLQSDGEESIAAAAAQGVARQLTGHPSGEP